MNEPSINRFSDWKSRLDVLATLLLSVVTVTVGGYALMDYLRPAPSTEVAVRSMRPPISMPLRDAPVKGSNRAKVAVVLFSDFECPICARAATLMPHLVTRYVDTGTILLVWRHYPLAIHSFARGAAEATECARRQGQFWRLHDWAFAHQQEIEAKHLREAATGLGLDMRAFDACMGGEAANKITSDIALAEQLHVEGTPTWFFGTVEPDDTVTLVNRITGLGPAHMYDEAIRSLVRSRRGVSKADRVTRQ